jgi:hypothetical protein
MPAKYRCGQIVAVWPVVRMQPETMSADQWSTARRPLPAWGGTEKASRLSLGRTAARYWYINPKLKAVDHLRWSLWGDRIAFASGSYTMLREATDGTQLACSGAFVRAS